MQEFFNIRADFFENPKTKQLEDMFGSHGIICLLQFWTAVAAKNPNGRIYGNSQTIEKMAGFVCTNVPIEYGSFQAGDFAKALFDIGFIRLDENQNPFIPNWQNHNPHLSAHVA